MLETGHFYFAKNRTFSFCLDIKMRPFGRVEGKAEKIAYSYLYMFHRISTPRLPDTFLKYFFKK
jgi:hypothetical protein